MSVISMQISDYGQMGVQLFFFASAFTLCHSWIGRTGEKQKLLNYWIRRYFRIAPIYYIGIAIYCLSSIAENYHLSGLVVPTEQYSFINILANMLFLHGFYPPANNNIVPGGWSIGTEMSFYLVFPALISLLIKSDLNNFFKVALFPLVTLVVSQLTLFVICMYTENKISNNTFIYYNLINQIPVFALGMSYYFSTRNNLWSSNSTIINILGFCCFTALSITLWRTRVDYFFSLIPFISGLSFLFLFRMFEYNQALNLTLIRKIGKVSYSMYLFHFLYAWKLSSGLSGLLEPHLGGELTLLLLYIMTISFTYLVASLTERFIESYFINIGRLLISRIKGQPKQA